MWRISYLCNPKPDHHYEWEQVVDRDPITVPPKIVKCGFCQRVLPMRKVENLGHTDYTRTKRNKRKLGFKAEQLSLF